MAMPLEIEVVSREVSGATNPRVTRPVEISPTKGLVLSIVVPVLNEEETLGQFLQAFDANADGIRAALGPDGRVEVIFVDDGSYDRTAEILEHLAAERSDVGLVRLSRNFGKDAALAAGLAHARG